MLAQNPKCKICGSADCTVEKNDFVTIKKHGKIVTEIGDDATVDKFGEIRKDIWENTVSFNKPLLVIQENDCKFLEELTNGERKKLLGKIELIKTKIIIKESSE